MGGGWGGRITWWKGLAWACPGSIGHWESNKSIKSSFPGIHSGSMLTNRGHYHVCRGQGQGSIVAEQSQEFRMGLDGAAGRSWGGDGLIQGPPGVLYVDESVQLKWLELVR